jgi:hypothetical protein
MIEANLVKGMKTKAANVPMGTLINFEECLCVHRKIFIPNDQLIRYITRGHTYNDAVQSARYPWFKLVSHCGSDKCAFKDAKQGHTGWSFDMVTVVKPAPKDHAQQEAKRHLWIQGLSQENITAPGDSLLEQITKIAKREQEMKREMEGLRSELADLIRDGQINVKELLANREVQLPDRLAGYLFSLEN